MARQKLKILSTTACMLFSMNAIASPASTEYVNGLINSLRNELTATMSTLASQINLLTTQVNTLTARTNAELEKIKIQVNTLPIITHSIGEIVQGGMVFYLDATGQHGLVVSLDDLGEPIEWRNSEGGDRVTNAKGQGLGSGETNTRLVISEQTIDQQDGDFAALRAANYQVLADGKTPCPERLTTKATCFGGWYLPSVYELILLHRALTQLETNTFRYSTYWSSSELNTTQSYSVDFSSGEPQVQEKSVPSAIRAIHNF